MSSTLTRLDLADQADVDLFAAGQSVGAPAGHEELGVLPREPDRLAAVEVDQADDLLVDLADEDHLDDLDGLLVGHPHAAHEARLLAQALHEGADLGAAAVHDDGVDADQAQEDDVEGEGLLEVGLLHGRPAVLDDHRLAAELPDVGERLQEDLGAAADGAAHRMYLDRSWSRVTRAGAPST